MGTLQAADRETLARNRRVQELCRQLARLVSLSREQRRAIDRLLGEIEAVARRSAARAASADRTRPSPTTGIL